MIIGDANLFIHTQQNRRNAEVMASVRPGLRRLDGCNNLEP